jgi:hypothetical protein
MRIWTTMLYICFAIFGRTLVITLSSPYHSSLCTWMSYSLNIYCNREHTETAYQYFAINHLPTLLMIVSFKLRIEIKPRLNWLFLTSEGWFAIYDIAEILPYLTLNTNQSIPSICVIEIWPSEYAIFMTSYTM